MSILQALDSFAQKAAAVSPREDGDYIGVDDLLYCGSCNTRKQCRIRLNIAGIIDGERVVSCLCKCAEEARAAEQRERERQEFLLKCEKFRRMGFADEKMRNWTFANDDNKNATLTKAMLNYVANFDEFRAQGKGLLLYGSVGSGKTYAACEVANALIDRGHPVLVTNFATLTNTLQEHFSSRQTYIDGLNRFELLVIDDLAAERDTEYMQETVYNIVDARYRMGLPMIITTNLSGTEIKNPDSISKERIYSRILERCHPIEVKGADRRRAALKDGYADMRKILGV